jgi:hypothetical protein
MAQRVRAAVDCVGNPCRVGASVSSGYKVPPAVWAACWAALAQFWTFGGGPSENPAVARPGTGRDLGALPTPATVGMTDGRRSAAFGLSPVPLP